MYDSELEFEKIFAAFQPKIHRYLMRLVGDNEAEDVTQEVFVRVAQALPAFRGECKLSTWLYRIATNAALDRLRHPSFRYAAAGSIVNGEAEVEDRNTWTGEKIPSTEQQLARQEMNDCIWDFVEKLPQNYRTVIILGELEGLKNKEIAEILGVTLDTVKIRLHRAKEKLKDELETHCDSTWVEENEFAPDLKRPFDNN